MCWYIFLVSNLCICSNHSVAICFDLKLKCLLQTFVPCTYMMHLSTKPPEIYNFVHTFAKLFMRLTFVIFPIGCHYFSCLTNASPFIFCPYYSTILEIPNKHFDSYQRQSKKNYFSFRNIHIHESKGVDIHYPVHRMIEWERNPFQS